MTPNTPRTDAAIELYGERPFMVSAVPVKFAQQLERELAESQAQSHGLVRRVVEAETKLEVAEQQIRNCLEIIDDDAKEKSELKDEVAKINHQLLNTESDLIQSQAEVERLKKELDAWDYGTRAKREQSRAEKAEAEVERLRSQLTRSVEIAEKIWADCSNGSEHTELATLKVEIK